MPLRLMLPCIRPFPYTYPTFHSENMPPTWKLAQLRVIEASPSLPSVISKPSSSSLLLVTLYSSKSLLSNVLLPFNPAILDQYVKQLSANLDSIKKGVLDSLDTDTAHLLIAFTLLFTL